MKFRAFDKTTNKMYYPPNEHIYLNIDGTCVNFQNGEKLEVMFATTLKDIKKNMIYVADICKGNGGAKDFYFEISFGGGCFIAKMPWIEGGKSYPELKSYTRKSFVKIEVVGNTKQHKLEDFQ